jgi:hypothetical protein
MGDRGIEGLSFGVLPLKTLPSDVFQYDPTYGKPLSDLEKSPPFENRFVFICDLG